MFEKFDIQKLNTDGTKAENMSVIWRYGHWSFQLHYTFPNIFSKLLEKAYDKKCYSPL